MRGTVERPGLTRVAVCAATLHRPVGLAALLESLADLRVPGDTEMTIVIVDNDAAGSAAAVVERFRPRIPGRLLYLVESRRGISFARNRAVAAVRDSDWVAFVDDDEVVADTWLVELLRVARAYHADVVTGTVLPHFESAPPAWLERGRFFERARFPTGTVLNYARTSNALVSTRLLTETDSPFSEAFALTGGSDTHLFQRIRLGGGTIVWADEAVVRETVPATRVRVRWLIQREFRRGNTLSLCLRDLEDSPRRRAKRVGAAVAHTLVGLSIAASSVGRGRIALLRGTRRVAFALGLLAGLVGHSYQEYAVVHGR